MIDMTGYYYLAEKKAEDIFEWAQAHTSRLHWESAEREMDPNGSHGSRMDAISDLQRRICREYEAAMTYDMSDEEGDFLWTLIEEDLDNL